MGGGDALGLVGVSIGLRGPLPWRFHPLPTDERGETQRFPRLLRSIEIPGTSQIEQGRGHFESLRSGPLGCRQALLQQGRDSVVHQPRNPDMDSGQPPLSPNH